MSDPPEMQHQDSLAEEPRDVLADGLVELLRPAVEEIDGRVNAVRKTQVELRQQMDSLAEDLRRITEQQPLPIELDSYVKKLNNSRRRVMLVNNILQNAQERLGKLHQSTLKETARRKVLVQEAKIGQNPKSTHQTGQLLETSETNTQLTDETGSKSTGEDKMQPSGSSTISEQPGASELKPAEPEVSNTKHITDSRTQSLAGDKAEG